MLYLVLLISLTAVSFIMIRGVLSALSLRKEGEFSELVAEYEALLSSAKELKEDNTMVEREVNQTLELYNISKDMSKELDENKILNIFKDRVKDYIKIDDCQFISKDVDQSRYSSYLSFPLVINGKSSGQLIANGIPERERLRFQILAQQFLVMVKRAFLYKDIQKLAIMDGLTQVFSRRHFLERFKEELRRSRKFKHSFSFLMVDIDKFKSFNDKYGHLVGDAILREASKTVKNNVRQIDFVGRYGGEELSIVLPETDKEQAIFAAERIRSAIEKREISVYDEKLKVSVSIGISTFPEDAEEAEDLIEGADKALYLAKKTGRNKVCAYRRK